MQHRELYPVNFGYSMKNIPTPNEKYYLKCLIGKCETFVRNIRWRTFFFLNPDAKTSTKETFGFKSTKSPPNIPELKDFEEKLILMIQNIRFRKSNDSFQNQLHRDIQAINRSKEIIVPADKTNNYYKLKPDEYEELLSRSIQKEYKKADPTNINETLIEEKNIATELELSDRIDIPRKNEAFVTLKDHKENFRNNPQTRLINPAKSEIGKISKIILERINTNIRETTGLNQWQNTNDVINWFNGIDNKNEYNVITFDICNFYPSISKDLLAKAIAYAETYTHISEQEKKIIYHPKKSTLYKNATPWTKKDNDFDVTMGSYDGAETCELVGLYLLSQMQDLNANIGIYRDDGLAICKETPQNTERLKKKICEFFKLHKLQITAHANRNIIDFLDITMNFNDGSYKPYMKPNNTPLYVNKRSNHPPNIKKNLPESINSRISSNSSNEDEFKRAAPPYQKALQQSGYEYKLQYNQNKNGDSERTYKRNRNRAVTWFNPPFNLNVATNIGKQFFKIIETSFPAEHKLHKLINKNTVKLSYSCTPNMEQIVSSHNKKIINETPTSLERKCNCRNKPACPLNGNCLQKSVIYQATVTRNDNNKQETYVGLTENEFKTRFTGHKASFTHENKKSSTTLSEYMWNLKSQNINHTTTWKILSKSRPYSPETKKCNLCLEERYFLLFKPHLASLNQRNEIASNCRHRKKFLLCTAKNDERNGRHEMEPPPNATTTTRRI